jgi:hypothetical protein
MAIIGRFAARSMPMISGLGLRTLSTSPILTGTVSWFDAKKGYGFIIPDDSEMPEGEKCFQACGRNNPFC